MSDAKKSGGVDGKKRKASDPCRQLRPSRRAANICFHGGKALRHHGPDDEQINEAPRMKRIYPPIRISIVFNP